mmetsp:Transcript_15985/g.39998  ORF Transcript_15985/g.39998 Transcript_15985/m.39998 type:complete len:140 (+) Transcript_15985:132-551(+)
MNAREFGIHEVRVAVEFVSSVAEARRRPLRIINRLQGSPLPDNLVTLTPSTEDSRAVQKLRECCSVHLMESDGCQAQERQVCPICFETLSIGQVAWRLPCFHLLHHACARKYFGMRGTKSACPICRGEVQQFRSFGAEP